MTEAATRFIEAIKSLGDWRSLELLGPPGAGKSYLSRQGAPALGVLTTCDRQAVRFYARSDFPWMTAAADRLLGERRLRNYYSARLRRYIRNYWNSAPADARRYRKACERVPVLFPVSHDVRKRFENRVFGSAALATRTFEEGRKLIVDEGLLNQLNSLVARSRGSDVDQDARDAIRDALGLYPWEKTALIVEASLQTCIRRQGGRDHMLFSEHRPQQVFHNTTDMLETLCREAGWRISRVNND